MLNNPFFVGKPISSQEFFIGRKDIKQIIIGGLPNLNSTHIIGERRTGKTSLLLEIQRRLRENTWAKPFLAIYMDCSQTNTVEQFWREFVSQLKLEASGQVAQIINQIETFSSPNKSDINITAVQIIKTLCLTHNIVILLDEFDRVLESEHFDGTFLSNLRSYGSFQVAYVVATRQHFAYHTTSDSPFFNIFTSVILGLFPEKEARDLLNKKLPEGGPVFSEKEIDYLCKISGGYPFFLQLAASGLYNMKYGGMEEAGRNWHDKLLGLIEPTVRKNFEYFWRKSSIEEKEFLLALTRKEMLPKNKEVKQTLLERSLIVDKGGETQPFSPIWAEWVLSQSIEDDTPAEEKDDARDLMQKVEPKSQDPNPKAQQINVVYAERAVVGGTMHENKTTISNVSGSTVNVDSLLEQVTQTIKNIRRADQHTKNEIYRLTTQLYNELKATPAEKQEEAEKLAKRMETLLREVGNEKPDKEEIEFNLESLKKAAQNISSVLPAILPIVTQIIAYIHKMMA